MIARARQGKAHNPMVHGTSGGVSTGGPVDTSSITRAWARKVRREQQESLYGLRVLGATLRGEKPPPPPRRKAPKLPKPGGWGKVTGSKSVYLTSDGRFDGKFRVRSAVCHAGTFDTEAEAREAVARKRLSLGLRS